VKFRQRDDWGSVALSERKPAECLYVKAPPASAFLVWVDPVELQKSQNGKFDDCARRRIVMLDRVYRRTRAR
jgi:hypothetical protein